VTGTVSYLSPDISQCIDAGLDTIGASSKKVVYWYLSEKRNLKREKIADNPTVFLETLRTLFGQGAGILERMIVSQLKQAFHLTLGESLEEVLALVKQKDSVTAKSGRLQTGLSKSSFDG
jgi:hypothetical protein